MDSNAFMKLSIYDATALEERLVEQARIHVVSGSKSKSR